MSMTQIVIPNTILKMLRTEVLMSDVILIITRTLNLNVKHQAYYVKD